VIFNFRKHLNTAILIVRTLKVLLQLASICSRMHRNGIATNVTVVGQASSVAVDPYPALYRWNSPLMGLWGTSFMTENRTKLFHRVPVCPSVTPSDSGHVNRTANTPFPEYPHPGGRLLTCTETQNVEWHIKQVVCSVASSHFKDSSSKRSCW
jgi:hypothetical protein